MAEPVLLPSANRTWIPWKNGGGEMCDIAVSPDGAGLDAFDWRVSIARIDGDRPFSLFPDMDRALMVVGGKGVRLKVEGLEPTRIDHKSPPFHFPGDVATSAQLIDGPVHALNVMLARGRVTTRIGRVDKAARFVSGQTAVTFFVCARGAARVLTSPTPVELKRHDAVRLPSDVQVEILPADHSHGWVIEIMPAKA